MGTQREYAGTQRDIYSVVLPSGDSPAREFLEGLKRSAPLAFKSMVNRYKRHADGGPSPNPKQRRHITAHGNLYEFKTTFGHRLLFFEHPAGYTVLTNGFHKGDPSQRAFDRAISYRDSVLEEGLQ